METARSLVEFYDRDPLENIVSLLQGAYKEVIFVYFARANEPTERERVALSRWATKRFGIPCRFLALPEHCIDCALEHFRAMLRREEGCYDFDITGGSSVFIAAAGALMAECGEGRMCIHEYDPVSGKCLYCYPPNISCLSGQDGSSLDVTEFLALRDVALLGGKAPIRYSMEADGLGNDLVRLWEAVRGELRVWNNFCNTSSDFRREAGGVSMVKMMSAGEYRSCQPIFTALERSGILHGLAWQREGNRLRVTGHLNISHRSAFLYEKAGNLLELLMYRAARESGCFADCCTGVKLDWSGRLQQGSNPNNEIDLVLTRGHLPCFVSCKNTVVTKEYLYEIMIMTRHFGGIHAVPMVFSTVQSGDAVRARAAEMGVVLLDGIGKLSAAETVQRLREVCGSR